MIPQIDVRELSARLAAGEKVHLLDVRQPLEHALAALPESQLIPLQELPGRVDEVRPAEGVPILVYCHHGVRSRTGAALLLHHGQQDVYSLAGGLDAWSLLVDARVPRY
jgi:rhodanese-related sulfurtransferase